jgi:hypothetical protein
MGSMMLRALAGNCLLSCLAIVATGVVAHTLEATRTGGGGMLALVQGTQVGKSTFPDGNTSRGGQGQAIDGIEGSSHEMLNTHIHAHLTIVHNGQQIAVPRGVGILPPFTISNGFVGSGKGFYWLHTHDATGILHVESPDNRVYTLGNFFDIWGQPLTESNVAGLKGPTRVYVNGRMQFGKARDLPLRAHDQIALVIGRPAMPPPQIVFPEGL